ncbi:acetyltransferase [Granulicella sibirica]|uniref:Acetyltransferase n=2 Tax=Granulicella sibirica TaxID=2479048 RepID=A0A4Q0T2D6_9BACT|nr:acetyltransferase [Granulicella sibirica]
MRPAREQDLPAIVTLMNAAFRGGGEHRGWSTEADYISGTRTSESLLREEIASQAQFFVVDADAPSRIRGCVSLKQLSPEKWYLGSLTVDPAQQNSGFGRELLAAAEDYLVSQGASVIEMTVVQLRHALISWYERRGYHLTGATRPFPYGDSRIGTPLRDDLSFVVLEKLLETVR